MEKENVYTTPNVLNVSLNESPTKEKNTRILLFMTIRYQSLLVFFETMLRMKHKLM